MTVRQSFVLHAVLLGAATSIAFGAVLGSLMFNILVRVALGSGAPFSEAYAAVPTTAGYSAFAVCLAIAANFGAGYVSAMLSGRKRYLHAVAAGSLVLVYSALLYLTPVSEVKLDALSFILSFLVPIPAVLLGAHYQSRGEAGG
ncbi:MAG: hypothetical protein O9312_10950 [Hylemonella sp.]|nr:hypothetical protein [Hylemonella sp.]